MFVFLVGMSYIYVEYCSVCVSCRHVLYIYIYMWSIVVFVFLVGMSYIYIYICRVL